MGGWSLRVWHGVGRLLLKKTCLAAVLQEGRARLRMDMETSPCHQYGRKSRPPKSEGEGRTPTFWLKFFCLITVIPLKTHTHYFSYILIGDKIGRQKLYAFPFDITPKQGKKDFLSLLHQTPKQGDGTHTSIPFLSFPFHSIIDH